MNLEYFFDPLNVENYQNAEETLGANVIFNNYDVEVLSQVDVVIFGLPSKYDTLGLCNNLREYLYQLYCHFDNIKIVDLGNLKSGNSDEDFRAAIVEVVSVIREKIIIALHTNVILEEEILKAVKDPSFVDVDAFVNNAAEYSCHEIKSVNVGCQKYLNSAKDIDVCSDNDVDIFRLGEVRDSIEIVEPPLRDADIVRISSESVRLADAPGQNPLLVNGFYADEICRIARYAGISDKVSAYLNAIMLPLYNIQTVVLCSQVVWHVLDGIDSRQGDFPKSKINLCNKYIVYIEEFDLDLVFYESKKTGRWWFEINDNGSQKQYACSRDTYESACKNELPDQFLKQIKRTFR